MATGARMLGSVLDIGLGFAPVDIQTATNTGKRISMQNAKAVTFVLIKAAGTAGDDPVLTLQEHSAYTGGTSQNLATITKYYHKSETTLDNDESWVEVSQTAAATISDPGGAGTSAETQQIVVLEVSAEQLSDGFTHVSVNVADVGGNAQLGTLIYIVDPVVKRKPANLGNLLRPGAANA